MSRQFHRSFALYLALLCVGLFGALDGNCQEAVYQRFTTEDGLPGNHINCVSVDSSGFVWAGTQGGAVRYDGYGFQVYDQDGGLPKNEILDIVEDAEGRVWLQGFNTLSFVRDGQLTPVPLPFVDSLPQAPRISLYRGAVFLRKEKDGKTNWIYHGGRWRVAGDVISGYPHERPYILNTYPGGGTWWAWSPEKIFRMEPSDAPFSIEVPAREFGHPGPSRYWGAIMLAKGGFFMHKSDTGSTFFLKDEHGQALPPALYCLEDSRGWFWVSTSSGVYAYDSQELLRDPLPLEHGLEKDEVTWMAEDAEHNMWFGTSRGGLIMRNAKSFGFRIQGTQAGLAGNSVEDIAVFPNGKVCVAHANGKLSFLEDGKPVEVLPVETQCRICRVRDILPIGNDSLFVLMDGNFQLIDLKTRVGTFRRGNAKCIRYQGGRFWLGLGAGLLAIPRGAMASYWENGRDAFMVFDYRTYATFWDGEREEVWIGTNEGLKVLHLPSGAIRTIPRVNSGVVDIQEDSLGRMWVATDGQGVFVFQGKESWRLSSRGGLSSNTCHGLLFDSAGGVWIGTPKGINYLNLSEHPRGQMVRHLSHSDGLPSNEVFCFAQKGGEVLAGTSKGLLGIPLDFFDRFPRKELSVDLEGMKVNGREVLVGGETDLAYDENEVELRYSALAVSAKGNIEYRYRMSGLGKGEWRPTRERKIDFQSLPAGDYRFEVQARLSDGDWGKSTFTQLSIAPHFSETSWFLYTCIALALVFALLGARWRGRQLLRRERKQSEREKMMMELELQALRAQMNPHFIFNALSAIQQFISSNDRLQAHRYLSTFSRLIRRVLENSRVEEIGLEEERTTLELYLSLEKLRFGDLFEYELTVSPSLQQASVRLPSMLIQPFVENAIQHGLRHKSGKGKLVVAFDKVEHDLRCTIEDDGIGRVASAKLKTSFHQPSRGVEITERRIRSIGELVQQKAKLEITDLFHPDGTAAGTRVEIFVPLCSPQIPSHA